MSQAGRRYFLPSTLVHLLSPLEYTKMRVITGSQPTAGKAPSRGTPVTEYPAPSLIHHYKAGTHWYKLLLMKLLPQKRMHPKVAPQAKTCGENMWSNPTAPSESLGKNNFTVGKSLDQSTTWSRTIEQVRRREREGLRRSAHPKPVLLILPAGARALRGIHM